jgi:hypothetical protein
MSGTGQQKHGKEINFQRELMHVQALDPTPSRPWALSLQPRIDYRTIRSLNLLVGLPWPKLVETRYGLIWLHRAQTLSKSYHHYYRSSGLPLRRPLRYRPLAQSPRRSPICLRTKWPSIQVRLRLLRQLQRRNAMNPRRVRPCNLPRVRKQSAPPSNHHQNQDFDERRYAAMKARRRAKRTILSHAHPELTPALLSTRGSRLQNSHHRLHLRP